VTVRAKNIAQQTNPICARAKKKNEPRQKTKDKRQKNAWALEQIRRKAFLDDEDVTVPISEGDAVLSATTLTDPFLSS